MLARILILRGPATNPEVPMSLQYLSSVMRNGAYEQRPWMMRPESLRTSSVSYSP